MTGFLAADALQIRPLLAFLERHGYALLFVWVLAEQSALPLPSAPLLLAAGALIRTGRLLPVAAVLSCAAPVLIADSAWFGFGRRRGRQVLRLVCRLSLEPDSCVRQTENAFVKYGLKILLVSKFIPGLNAVAAPMAGNSDVSYLKFALYDTAGAFLWSGALLACGYLFSHELEDIGAQIERLGSGLVFLIAAAIAVWVGWKYLQRRRFLKQLDVARVTPTELRRRLDAGDDVFIVDLRGGRAEDVSIPGAVRISPEELAARRGEIPLDRDIVLFCS